MDRSDEANLVPPVAVIISGLPGTGKTSAANHLRQLGFHVVAAGETVREICRACGLHMTREMLQETGSRVLRENGSTYFAHLLISKLSGSLRVVFEGVRQIEVLNELRKVIPNVYVIYVHADEKTRELRLSLKDGLQRRRFMRIMRHPVELDVLKIRAAADKVIVNQGSLIAFCQEIQRTVESFLTCVNEAR